LFSRDRQGAVAFDRFLTVAALSRRSEVMAVVRCLSCGRLLYRPDEMAGTAWQCITCGPTQVASD